MSSRNKRRFFERDASPVVATDDDFDAVFGPVSQQPASNAQDIVIERIRTNPFQARTKFKDIGELAESMRTHGFTSRLRVRRDPSQPQFFQLVYGERRLRAAQVAGIKVIPCDVADYSDQQMREIGLTENLQRSDLEPLEEARAFRVAIDQGAYSIRSLATQIGKSKGYVQSRLDLLRAPEDVQQMVDHYPETFTAGLLIGQLPTAELRRPLIESVIKGNLDKEAIRGIVRDLGSHTDTAGSDHTLSGGASDPALESAPGRSGDGSQGRELPRVGSPGSRNGTHATSTRDEKRATRASERALTRATETLRAMTTQLQDTLPELRERERVALLDFIVEQHFPEFEKIVQELRNDEK